MTDAWRDTVLEVIKTQPEGCTQELLQSTLEKIDGIAADDVPAIIQDGLNWLLKKGFVELLQSRHRYPQQPACTDQRLASNSEWRRK